MGAASRKIENLYWRSNMAMSREDAENIVSQLQQAHRVSVAFYKRILPTFDKIADQLGCVFLDWEPIYTDIPKKGKRHQPSQSWAWEYVPLFASTHSYQNTKSEKRSVPEDFGLVFDLIVDDSFSEEVIDKGEPNPIDLAIGKGVVKVALYRPRRQFNKSFGELWDEEVEMDAGVEQWAKMSESWNGYLCSFSLVDVILDADLVSRTLKKIIDNKAEVN